MFHPKGTSFGRRGIDAGKKPDTFGARSLKVTAERVEQYIHQVSAIVPPRCRGLFRPMMSRKHSAAPAAFQRHHRTEKTG